MVIYETLTNLWPNFFGKKSVKIIATIIMALAFIGAAILMVYAIVIIFVPEDENTKKLLTANEEFEQVSAISPVKLVFTKLIGTDAVDHWFNYGKIISMIEKEVEELHKSGDIDFVSISREFNSKKEVERYFEKIDEDLLVISGSVQSVGDTAIFRFNFSPICEFRDLLTINHLGVTVENNSKSLIESFTKQFVDDIIVKFNTFYIFHLAEDEKYSEMVEIIKKLLPFYDKPNFNKPAQDYYSFMYSKLCEAYIQSGFEDSAMKYASIGYELSPNSNHCYNYKSQALLIYSGDNIDSLKLALELINASEESIRSGKWQRDAFVSRIYAEMCQIESNSQNFENAINYADSSIYLDSTFFKPFLLKAMILIYNCNLEDASVNIKFAFKKDSTIFHTNYYLAVISALNSNFKKSHIYFNNAFFIKPKEFILEYDINVYNLEKCEYKYMDSVRWFTSNIVVYK